MSEWENKRFETLASGSKTMVLRLGFRDGQNKTFFFPAVAHKRPWVPRVDSFKNAVQEPFGGFFRFVFLCLQNLFSPSECFPIYVCE